MYNPRSGMNISRVIRSMLAIMLLGMMAVLSACGGDAQTRQQASQNQAHLDQLLKHAQVIGVPSALLRPVLLQEQQLSQTTSPFNPFNDQISTDYYRNLSTRYAELSVQTQGIITTATQQAQTQAQQRIQQFQLALTRSRTAGLPVAKFTQQFTQCQSLMATARYPKDYAAISGTALGGAQALDLLQTASEQLTTFKQTIAQMNQAHLDVTAIQAQYESDQQALMNGVKPRDFQQLSMLIDAQYQEAVVNSTQAIPYITAAKLSDFQNKIQTLKQYGVDTSAYQKKLDADLTTMQKTMSIQDYTHFAKQVDGDVASMHDDLMQAQARYLVRQFHQEVDSWGNAHLYHDSFNGQNYALDTGYMSQGMGSDLDQQLAGAATSDDFQAVTDAANNALFNLRLLEADYNDHTPYNQVHATDTQVLAHYKIKGQVLVISLVQQAMRLYQDGRLVRSFQVTTGRSELPSVPGVWSVLDRQSPTVFKSPDPPGSPYWYPDTPIHYAILYHEGGYYVHDAWWRVDYGPGTQFPHNDSGGDESFAGDGSHGCVNVQEDQAAWVYNNTNWNTSIVIY